MDHAIGRGKWARRTSRAAILLCVGAVAAALIGAIGAGQEAWGFRAGLTISRYAFYAAGAGAVVALIALALAQRARDSRLVMANVLALIVAAGFFVYLWA